MRLFIEGWFASENEGPPTRGPLTKGSPTKDPPTKDQYIPFAQDTIVRALQNVRVLTISHFHWHALPHRYHVTAAQYPIVELSIIGGYFNTFADLLRVVWAFRHLRTLRLIDVEFERVSRTNLESISLNRPRVCHELTDLYVVGTYSIDMNHHVPYLRSLPRLQELTWRVDRSWAPWESKYLTKFSSYVGATLVGLHQDSTLARLTLQFEPQGISNIGRNAYMRRTDFLRDVLSPDFVNILRRTQRVHHLQLIVPEPKRAENNADLWKDASWWKKQVATYMLRTKVAVHVDISVTGEFPWWVSARCI
ncbi:hypothetical protein TRAPUB_14084 [Trametes pubescens]|uniref:Uncharacterized protein n=1 Tax=Trametes pubescens TaxID=154538 RepID=A0A1M2VP89_TRAPU|nr:hypothetical protein TRAPUB_14084 [Trametes pubescens]